MAGELFVQITNPSHPHYREYGWLTHETANIGGALMMKVRLECCRHGTRGCFVFLEDYQLRPDPDDE